ncbi:P-loop ATPase, Sll1717 family [Pseudoprimorskyibacter insulae]|uniref:Uncharacterized protein n=1 Tax=Pseudoprimorskyibacter insulae TaxID=1695997 RepID=A0A2R8AQ42_9RHOB|nr:hypothetical protein [Pseudoprimorskyibacter insulae]SPF78152.1 hypothetical protein PRI8871_00745 [Pseudoprimorskyibacter insulae]
MQFRQLFGNEHAAADDLLEDCYVPPPGTAVGNPILVGRWGTGKTGLLLHRNAKLSRVLRDIDPNSDRIWYLDETGIQLQTLQRVQELCNADEHLVKRVLEDLWKSEILRCAVASLYHLYDFYGRPTGPHWDEVIGVFGKTTTSSVWEWVPALFGSFSASEKKNSLQNLMDRLREISSQRLMNNVQACLRDIKDHPVQPSVAIEPIETPDSRIEDETDLAQTLVTCLLNVFYKYFQPSYRQLLRVEISIPWHRYVRDQVGEPQKLTPFVGRFKWTPSSLKGFINKRIEWEFRRVGRSFVQKGTQDAWSLLFEPFVRNSVTRTPEDSFEYVLRHSQYRVRDVLRMTRMAVEFEAVKREVDTDTVLRGRGGLKVTEKSFNAAIRRACADTSVERVLEASRRFPGIGRYIEALRGISVPFDFNELKKRRWSHLLSEDEKDGVFKAFDQLWSAGIIGIQLHAQSKLAVDQLKGSIGSSCLSKSNRSESEAVFYVFDHLSDRKPYEILTTFDHSDGGNEHHDIQTKIVVHPIMFEYLDVRPVSEFPIGI